MARPAVAAQQIIALLEQGQAQQALPLARRFARAQPREVFGWKALGICCLELGQCAEAIEALRRARALQPGDVEVLNTLGNALHRGSRSDEAVAVLAAAIQRDPKFYAAQHNLARVLGDTADWPALQRHCEAMVQLWPQQPDCLTDLARALLQQGRPMAAWHKAMQALVLQADLLPAWRIRALASEASGKYADACKAYDRLLALVPGDVESALGMARIAYADKQIARGNDWLQRAVAMGCPPLRARKAFVEALVGLKEYALAEPDLIELAASEPQASKIWSMLAWVQLELGKVTAAIESLQRAARLQADDAAIHNNLGVALLRAHALDAARSAFEAAIACKPDYAGAHQNLAKVWLELGDLSTAKLCIDRALELDDNDASSYVVEAQVLCAQNRVADAQVACNVALRMDPDHVPALNQLATMAQDNGHFALALTLNKRAAALEPQRAVTHIHQGNIYKNLGDFKAALKAYMEGLRLQPDDANAFSNMLFALNYIGEVAPTTATDQARRYGALVQSKAQFQFAAWQASPAAGRIRVGFVSGDLRGHPVGYFLEALLNHLDGARFELFAYSTTAAEDALTARIKPFFAQWRMIKGLDDAAAARRIHTDAIQVLFDLSGHTGNSRLAMFAYRPAPVQVSYLGYFATTGVAEIDYFLGDRWVTPPEDENQFVEKIWRLPNSYWCYTPPLRDVAVSPLPALANGHVSFGCFNNLSKLNARVIDLWCEVLRAVPKSRLILKSKQLDDSQLHGHVIGEFSARGVDAARISCEGWSGLRGYLEAYHRIDLALDPFPFPGGTTSMDCWWMGVPVISLKGDRLVGHNAETVANNLGMGEWVCGSVDQYLNKAIHWASALPELAQLRSGLRQRVEASPLMDGPQFGRDVGQAIDAMHRRYEDAAAAAAANQTHKVGEAVCDDQ